jgi:hypothetical protein
MVKYYLRDPGPFLESSFQEQQTDWEAEESAAQRRESRTLKLVAAGSFATMLAATVIILTRTGVIHPSELGKSFADTGVEQTGAPQPPDVGCIPDHLWYNRDCSG